MSKGLEALKDIKQAISLIEFAGSKDKQWINDELRIIEQELKDKEELAQALSIVTCENGDLLKYKKALEILKAFDFIIEDYTKELNGSVCVSQRRIILDNEEIDLLKEVLL